MVSLNKATFNHVKNQLGKINQQKHLLTPFPVPGISTADYAGGRGSIRLLSATIREIRGSSQGSGVGGRLAPSSESPKGTVTKSTHRAWRNQPPPRRTVLRIDANRSLLVKPTAQIALLPEELTRFEDRQVIELRAKQV